VKPSLPVERVAIAMLGGIGILSLAAPVSRIGLSRSVASMLTGNYMGGFLLHR
jgi:hypothetical protein